VKKGGKKERVRIRPAQREAGLSIQKRAISLFQKTRKAEITKEGKGINRYGYVGERTHLVLSEKEKGAAFLFLGKKSSDCPLLLTEERGVGLRRKRERTPLTYWGGTGTYPHSEQEALLWMTERSSLGGNKRALPSRRPLS